MTVKSFDSHAAAVHCPDHVLDRRTFLGKAGITAGAVIVSGIVSLSSEETTQTGCSTAAVAPVLPSAAVDSTGLGHVDDMWGHWPRYAHPIPHACVQPDTVGWEKVDLIDRMWVS
jgi:hypothetical protein